MTFLAWIVGGLLLMLLAIGGLVAGGMAYLDRKQRPPIEPQQLADVMEQPLLVVDTDGTVVMDNVAFRNLFDRTQRATDQPVSTVLADYPGVQAAIEEEQEVTLEVELAGDRHYVSLDTFPIGDGQHRPYRRLVVFDDASDTQERHTRLARLERRNEQLDKFASVISHDLRNPLDVAVGKVGAVKHMLDDEELRGHLEDAQDAHMRMQRIIEGVLTVAREGEQIGETEQVNLDSVAEDAWKHTRTEDGTLSVETDLTVIADRDRLLQALENLFRNSIEHGGESVTVTVDGLSDGSGFVVADDGPGLPSGEVGRMFEAGVSDGGGTGLGLAIVESIAEGHGWEVVADHPGAGARFEFHGVECVARPDVRDSR